MTLMQSFLRSKRINVSTKHNSGVFTLFCLSFVISSILFSSSSVWAQTRQTSSKKTNAVTTTKTDVALSSIAPFVNDKTLFVAKVNLDNIDLEALGTTTEKLFVQTLEQLGFSASSIKDCSKEFHKTIEAVKSDQSLQLNEVKAQLGITEAYYIIQSIDNEGACLIIPAKSLTPDQINATKEWFESKGINCALYQKSFLIASTTSLKEIGAYYKTFKPSVNSNLNNFFKSTPNKFLAFYASRFKLRAPLAKVLNLVPQPSNITEDQVTEKAVSSNSAVPSRHTNDSSRNLGREKFANEENKVTFLQGSAFEKTSRVKKVEDPFEDFPRCVKDMIEIFDTSFVACYGYIDASTLRSSVSLKFSSPVNASKFNQELEKSLDEAVVNIFKPVQEAITEGVVDNSYFEIINQYKLLPVVREFLIGEMHPHLPQQADSVLTFDNSVEAELTKIGPNTIAVLGETLLTFQAGKALEESKSPFLHEVEVEELDSIFEDSDQNAESQSAQDDENVSEDSESVPPENN